MAHFGRSHPSSELPSEHRDSEHQTCPINPPVTRNERGDVVIFGIPANSSVRRFPLAKFAAAVLPLFFMFAVTAWTVWDARHAALVQAEQTQNNIALAIEGELERTFNGYDHALQAVVNSLAIPGLASLPENVQRAILFAAVIDLPGLDGVGVTDVHGDVTYQFSPAFTDRINLSDRDYFKTLAAEPGAGLVVQPHPVYFRTNGQAGLVLARRINDPNGSFAGVVLNGIRLSFIQSLFDRLELGRGGIINFVSTDGTLIARRPSHSGDTGRDLTHTEAYEHLSVVPSGVVESTSAIDGIRRITTFRKMPGLPFNIGVGFPVSEIYRDWWRKSVVVMVAEAVMTLVALVLAAALWRELGRRGAAEQAAHHAAKEIARITVAIQHAEAEARRQAAVMKSIYTTAQVGLCMMDLECRFVELNDYVAKFIGLPAAQCIGRRRNEIGYDGDGKVETLIRQVIATGLPIEGVEAQVAMPGSLNEPRDWLVSFHPVFDDAGAVIAVCEAVFDITSRKRAEAELERLNNHLEDAVALRTALLLQSEHRLESFWENAPDALFLIADDEAGRISFVRTNPAFAQHLGLSHAETQNRTPQEIMTPAAASMLLLHYHACVAAGDLVRYSHSSLWDGAIRDTETLLKPIRGPRGEVTHVLGSKRDLTERNKLQAQFAQAQKMEAVGQLTGGVAHDFNNLLTVVLGNVDYLRRRAKEAHDSRGVRLVDMIEQAAERGGRLASQLLAFSRRQTLRPERVQANDLLLSVHGLLENAATEAVNLTISSEPGLWHCFADPAQLESAVLNLVINARDAMQASGGQVNIQLSNVVIAPGDAARLDTAPGDYVCIAVSDNGAGMTPEVRERACEPFFTTKLSGRGSGLGLAQVMGFVGQSGGSVQIDSEVGRGTTISLLLPREQRTAQFSIRPRSADYSGPVHGQGRTVLVVEDEPDLRETVSSCLSDAGYRVVTAGDGLAARRVLASDQIVDILFTDIVLPGGVSGYELAAEAQTSRRDIRLLMTTGYAGRPPDTLAIDLTKMGLLSKPYGVTTLLERIAELQDPQL